MKQAGAGISNVGVRSRIKQILILIVAIVIGVLIAQAADAKSSNQKSVAVHQQSK